MLNLLKRSHDDRPSRPRVERTVHRVRHKQFRLERLRPIYPTRPTEFKRWFSSQSSRSGSPFICAPPPANTTLLVSSFRIYARLPREESPPRRTSECTRESCPATPVRHPASYSASVRLRRGSRHHHLRKEIRVLVEMNLLVVRERVGDRFRRRRTGNDCHRDPITIGRQASRSDGNNTPSCRGE